MFKSLRIRLTLLFVGLTILPLLVAGALIASRSFGSLESEALRFQDQVAHQTALSLEAFFHERQNELQVLTQVYGFDTQPFSTQRSILLALLSKQPAYYELRLVQADGQEKLHLIRGEIATENDPVNRSNDPVFQSAIKTNRVSYSEVHFSEAARDRLVTIAVPMQDLFTGDVGSVLIAEVRFSNVEAAVIEDFTFAQGEDVYVTDRNGVVIAHRNPSFVLKETSINLPDTDRRYPGLTNKDAFIDVDTIALGNLELKVVAEISYEKATALATESTQISVIITVITLFVAGFIVAFAVTRVVNPIVQLSHVANAIQAGDFSQRSATNRSDEIGQFAAAFNAMSDAIQKREEDLKQQANELRIATAKAREAARVKSEFLANVSHELRTPLNAIIGFSDMLLMGMTGELNDKQRHKIERLLENGNRLLTLINHILDLTRIEARRIEIVNKPFSPAALVDRVANQMQVLADKNNLELSTNVDPTLSQVLLGDEQRIEQVIVNLLSNAFKFTEKGKVDLEISQNVSQHEWTITVTDTGIGIPPHALDIIFEEFRQVDGSSSRAFKGSGLGLAITRNLVRIMNGQINVQSQVGVGSKFIVSLPIIEEPTPSAVMLEKA